MGGAIGWCGHASLQKRDQNISCECWQGAGPCTTIKKGLGGIVLVLSGNAGHLAMCLCQKVTRGHHVGVDKAHGPYGHMLHSRGVRGPYVGTGRVYGSCGHAPQPKRGQKALSAHWQGMGHVATYHHQNRVGGHCLDSCGGHMPCSHVPQLQGEKGGVLTHDVLIFGIPVFCAFL